MEVPVQGVVAVAITPEPLPPAKPFSAVLVPAADTPASESPHPRGNGQRIAALVVGGLGIAGVGVGAYFGVQALSKHNQYAPLCPNDACVDQSAVQLHNDAASDATIGRRSPSRPEARRSVGESIASAETIPAPSRHAWPSHRPACGCCRGSGPRVAGLTLGRELVSFVRVPVRFTIFALPLLGALAACGQLLGIDPVQVPEDASVPSDAGLVDPIYDGAPLTLFDAARPADAAGHPVPDASSAPPAATDAATDPDTSTGPTEPTDAPILERRSRCRPCRRRARARCGLDAAPALRRRMPQSRAPATCRLPARRTQESVRGVRRRREPGRLERHHRQLQRRQRLHLRRHLHERNVRRDRPATCTSTTPDLDVQRRQHLREYWWKRRRRNGLRRSAMSASRVAAAFPGSWRTSRSRSTLADHSGNGNDVWRANYTYAAARSSVRRCLYLGPARTPSDGVSPAAQASPVHRRRDARVTACAWVDPRRLASRRRFTAGNPTVSNLPHELCPISRSNRLPGDQGGGVRRPTSITGAYVEDDHTCCGGRGALVSQR